MCVCVCMGGEGGGSSGNAGLLSTIHQSVHPPGSNGGKVYGGNSTTLGLSPQKVRQPLSVCEGGGRGEGA